MPGIPLYRQVKRRLVEVIENGVLTPGERFPSTKTLSELLEVSLVTCHRAMRELETAGYVRRTQGRGTFVLDLDDRRAAGPTIGVILNPGASLADFYHSQIIEGMRTAGQEHGVELLITSQRGDRSDRCAGWLLVNPERKGVTFPPGKQPRMIVGARPRPDCPGFVDVDNVLLSQLAIESLHKLGHRRIAYVGGTDRLSNSHDRHVGYQDACTQLNIETSDRMSFEASGWQLDAHEKDRLRAALEREDRPTAIYAGGYFLALDVMSLAREIDLSIPDDLSLIAVDDPPSASHLTPTLTTLRQPLIQMGFVAVDQIVRQIRGEEELAHGTVLHAELVERGTTAQR